MQFITGTNRHKTCFSTLEDQVTADNPVKLMDAFIDKLDLQKLGFTNTVHKSEGERFTKSINLSLSKEIINNYILSSFNRTKVHRTQCWA